MTPEHPFDLAAYQSVSRSVERDLRKRYPDRASEPWVSQEASRYARQFVRFLLPDRTATPDDR